MRIDENDTDDGIAKDGEVLRVPLYAMDGRAHVHDGAGGTRMHQPGHRFGDASSELRRAEARDAYIHELGDAWRGAR